MEIGTYPMRSSKTNITNPHPAFFLPPGDTSCFLALELTRKAMEERHIKKRISTNDEKEICDLLEVWGETNPSSLHPLPAAPV